MIDSLQLILVEPDANLLGWGVAKFVGFLQDVEVVGDKDDSRCLHITVHRGGATHNRTPLLSAKFVFDDHIRCMAAKQRLTKVTHPIGLFLGVVEICKIFDLKEGTF